MVNVTPNSEVYSVSELVDSLRRRVERYYGSVTVMGEISGIKRHVSGHVYFALNDADAQLRCVMWQSRANSLRFEPVDGQLVEARGQVTIYSQRGQLQMVVRSLSAAGEGDLQKKFEQLKLKLGAEGLFEREHKRSLPRFPMRIGVITSASGAALQDILRVLHGRYRLAPVLVFAVPVQGPGTGLQIARTVRAISDLAPDSRNRPDVMIIGRGGGSPEDLWEFNDERLARAMFDCTIPIVSAVGHETDFSIADFIADARAATPSMAAEMITPDGPELVDGIVAARERMQDAMWRKVENGRQRVDSLVGSFHFQQPAELVSQYHAQARELYRRLGWATTVYLDQKKKASVALGSTLAALDPNRPLKTGYARIRRDGGIVMSASSLRQDDEIELEFDDGSRSAQVT